MVAEGPGSLTSEPFHLWWEVSVLTLCSGLHPKYNGDDAEKTAAGDGHFFPKKSKNSATASSKH